MEDLARNGKAKSLGLSFFNLAQLEEVMASCRICPKVIEIMITDEYFHYDIVEYCKKNGLVVMAGVDHEFLNNMAVMELSKIYNKSPAQIALRWLYQRGLVPQIYHDLPDTTDNLIKVNFFSLFLFVS